jgi:hypothetical protein
LEETNYVELKKPENPIINLTLNAPKNEKGEYLIRYPHVKYKLEIPAEYQVYNFRLFVDNESYYIYRYSDNYFQFDYPYYDVINFNPFSLKCEIVILPDSAKSIAEISGYEYLGKTFEWKMAFDLQPTPQLYLDYKKLDEKTYHLTWNEPDPYYGGVSYYEIEYYDPQTGYSYRRTNELFYDLVLPGDTYSRFEYRVTAYFKENFLSSISKYGYIYFDNY